MAGSKAVGEMTLALLPIPAPKHPTFSEYRKRRGVCSVSSDDGGFMNLAHLIRTGETVGVLTIRSIIAGWQNPNLCITNG